VLLNILTQSMEGLLDTIPTQRVVFLVKNLIHVLQEHSESAIIKTEAFRTLSAVLRPLSEIYGSHWAESIEVLCTTWKEIGGGDAGLLVLHSSLRLFSVLRDLVQSDSNDDLTDAWNESKSDLFENLFSTLYKLGMSRRTSEVLMSQVLTKVDASGAVFQPRDITADLLRRELVHIPVEYLTNKNDMFSLLAAECKNIQQTAFEILHRHIPQAQEQVSFDVALSKAKVNLPDELLSLLLEVPQAKLITPTSDTKTWVRIRSYLLSWKLVFDHFSNSVSICKTFFVSEIHNKANLLFFSQSLPVQENYAENIKENQNLAPLLEFTFDFLQKAHGKLIDASKFEIRSWEPTDEPGEKDTQWLLIHIYYLALRHLSTFTKNWWIDSQKRIKGPVEIWTEKYVSIAIVLTGNNLYSQLTAIDITIYY
jgi:E3 ubiquitin-protein ligase listerin